MKHETDMIEKSWLFEYDGREYLARVEILATCREYRELTGEWFRDVSLEIQDIMVDDAEGNPVDADPVVNAAWKFARQQVADNYLDLCREIE